MCRRGGGEDRAGGEMKTLSDTHPDIERLQIKRLRQMPAWRKMALVAEMNQAVTAILHCYAAELLSSCT